MSVQSIHTGQSCSTEARQAVQEFHAAVAHGVDLVNNLEQAFDKIRAEIGPLQHVFACDCILRNLEVSQDGLKDRVEEIFRRNNTIGFSSYGEQFYGVHVNQTLTGVAIGIATESTLKPRNA